MSDVLIDITRLLDRGLKGRLPTGVDRVSLEYVRHFGGRSQALVRYGKRWVILGPTDSARVFEALLSPRDDFAWVVRWCVGKAYALSWNGGMSRRVLFNTGHSGLEHPGYAAWVRDMEMLPIFFAHDLIPITYPEYCRPGEAERHRARLNTMLSVGEGVVVNSNMTGQSLEKYARRNYLPLPSCVVAPLAPGCMPLPKPVRPIAEPYFVMLGTIEPRKNHLTMLHLWRQLAESNGPTLPRLVIVGQRGWECEQVLDLLDRCAAIESLVIERAGCDDTELATWLHYAQALLFPSFSEGFGMPLVEALAMGLPVIASDLSVFREVAGEIPEYLDPLDGPGWKGMVLEYASPNSTLRRAQCCRLAGFRAPTWGQHFAAVDDLVAQVVAEA